MHFLDQRKKERKAEDAISIVHHKRLKGIISFSLQE